MGIFCGNIYVEKREVFRSSGRNFERKLETKNVVIFGVFLEEILNIKWEEFLADENENFWT
jgi:hypothetical protein